MRRLLALVALTVAVVATTGCGGGSGSGGSSSGNKSGQVKSTGQFVLAYSGGGLPGVKHAYVTVTKVILNEDIDRAWTPGDTTWQTVTLGLPVTIDLAEPNGFIVGSQTGGVSVPIGTYQQVRLILAGHDEELKASASAKSLTYNAQIEYEGGAVVPLELPNVQAGFRLDRGVSISSSSGSTTIIGGMIAHLGLDRNLARFDAGWSTADGATLRMRAFSTRTGADAGIIWGQLDPTYLCGSSVLNVPGGYRCASNVMVSLYKRSGDGLFPRMSAIMTTKIAPSAVAGQGVAEGNGMFFLGPVAPDETDGINTYDLVIRGEGMRTMVVQGVPIKPISTDLVSFSENGVSLVGTYLGRTWDAAADGKTYRSYIRPQLLPVSETESLASLSSNQTPASSRMVMGLRLSSRAESGVALPYELVAGNTDPFTGALRQALVLPKGNPLVAVYSDFTSDAKETHTAAAHEAIYSSTFVDEAPVDGVASYKPMALGRFYDDGDGASSVVINDSATTFAPIPLALKAALPTRSVTVTASGLPTAVSRADLVVSDVGGIVKTQSVTIQPDGTASATVTDLPTGPDSYGYATGVYSFAIRTQESGNTLPSGMKWFRSAAQLDLRSGSNTSISIP